MRCIYTMDYYSARKRNEKEPFAAAWMDLEFILLSEVGQTEKTHATFYHLYVWNLKYDTNEPIDETEIDSHTENRHVVAKEKGGGRRMPRECRVSRCKRSHRKDKHQGPPVEHRELYSTSCDKPHGKD